MIMYLTLIDEDFSEGLIFFLNILTAEYRLSCEHNIFTALMLLLVHKVACELRIY
jgi:hypothetical protein